MPTIAILGNGLLLLACLLQGRALLLKRFSGFCAIALMAALGLLLVALVFDHFELAYIASYSAAELPFWLKIATLWGGEEGTLLLLATLYAGFAWRVRNQAQASAFALALMGFVFTLACLWWNPFAPASSPVLPDGQGMNAHLTNFWMAIHPPAVFLAYALLWAPLGAALKTLEGGDQQAWRAMVVGPALTGWCLLSVGIASGMWWAFQDFNYGQFWHWDPVQTAALIIWLLASAQLHGARQTVKGLVPPRAAVWASVLTALAIPMALWIVRDATLASSHRYVGDTSWPLMAAVTAVVLVFSLARMRGKTSIRAVKQPGGLRQLIRWAANALLASGIALAFVLAYSYVCAAASCSRSFAPFRAALLTWASGDEARKLNAAFAQWEVDYFIAVPVILPLVAVLILLIGYTFFRTVLRWPLSLTVVYAALSAGFALWWQPLDEHFDGTGVTTSHTQASFIWLEVLLLWCLWPVLATLAWLGRVGRQKGWGALRYSAPVAAIHLGVIALIVGATISTTLDRTRQAVLDLPAQYGQFVALDDTMSIRVDKPRWHSSKDGAIASPESITALSDIALSIGTESNSLLLGTTSYRDNRLAWRDLDGPGAFRQRCTILDYRYARVIERPGMMMHPAINHGFLSDKQVWMPAFSPADDAGQHREVLVLLREFPLLSILWAGLLLIVTGALTLVLTTHLTRR